jgi:hypothetical protein
MIEEDRMSIANNPAPISRNRVAIDAGRLWGGGVATALVAALAAAVGVLICSEVFDVKLVQPPLLRLTDSFPVNYAITAAALALAACVFRLDRRSGHGRHDGVAVRPGGEPEGEALCGSDQYGHRPVHY